MTRYRSQLEAIASRLRTDENAIALIIVPETQQPLIAELLGQLLERRHVALGGAGDPADVVNCIVTLGGGPPIGALSAINSRRHWITDRGSLVFVVSRNDLQVIQQHAADIVSVALVAGHVCHEPAVNGRREADDRNLLAAHYRSKFGAVDLRGFIRTEVEDVSFPLESIFQPLQGTRWVPSGPRELEIHITAALPEFLQEKRPVMLVGPPGCGKSFFLRWYALTGSSAEGFLGIERPLPLHISLAAFSSAPGAPTLREFLVDVLLQQRLGIVDHLPALEAAGRLVFLLDGLDEAGDAPARRRVVSAVDMLQREFPRSRIITTSRRAGLEDVERVMDEISIEPMVEDGIRALLTTWCALYERVRAGTPAAEARGRLEGAELTAEVLRSDSLRELASTPLLATIIAIVHRAGVQLPEHRAELYDHIAKILVERWNQVRSATARSEIPLRAADAIRLLGPVALELIDSDSEGAVSEDRLRAMLQRSLAVGVIRGVGSAEEAIDMFRRSLGLLVERAPGVYGFLHQTLLEFFAAHELVRTGRLEDLCRDLREAFLPKWREALLLSFGILGQLQANDPRLDQVVHSLVQSASQLRDRPSPAVPSLLADIVADDSSLSSELATTILAELVPRWWFATRYGSGIALQDVVLRARNLERRIRRGRWADLLLQRLALVPASLEVASLLDTGISFPAILGMLHDAGVEISSTLCDAIIAAQKAPSTLLMPIWTLRSSPLRTRADGTVLAAFSTTPGVSRLLQQPELRPLWEIAVLDHSGVSLSEPGWFDVDAVTAPVGGRIALELTMPLHPLDEQCDAVTAPTYVAELAFVPAHANASMAAALEQLRRAPPPA